MPVKVKEKLNNMMFRAAPKIQRFMYGRYGRPDELYRFNIYFTFGLIILNFFIHSFLLSNITFFIIAYNVYRILSRKIDKRYNENERFVSLVKPFTKWLNVTKKRMKDKDHAYKKCPHCKQYLRLPNVKGDHSVNCPRCHQQFDVKI